MSAGPARVLEALRSAAGRPLTGVALSESHGVSRTQIWKDVETLRARGYQIDAEPGGGYRLVAAPDRLYPEELRRGLETRWMACEIHHLDETDSTNRVALELARDGAPHGATVVAEGQTAGRGRLGRSFFSPPYLNLYSSTILRPALDITQAPAWILASAVAVAEAISETLEAPDAVEIKWPNDVLVNGRKSSGILMELGAEATRIAFLVLGIGVNLNVDPSDFPAEFRATATSLAAERGAPIDRVAFARTLYGWLEKVLDACAAEGFRGILPRFEARFRMRGREVGVREQDGKEHRGRVHGIDTDGALLLELAGGSVARFVAGDVTLAKEGDVTLLVVDIGNTNVSLGLFDYGPSDDGAVQGTLSQHWRIGTHREHTSDEVGLVLHNLFTQSERSLREVKDVIISSVVPPLLPIYERVSTKLFDRPPLIVGPGIRTGMPVRYENPREVGADRIVNALAAYQMFGGPVVAVDFGTATTFDCVSEGGEYLGGVIFPGIHTSMEALFERASMLHRVEIARPRSVIGKTTTAALQSGLLYGTAGVVDAMIDRIREELGPARVVATGGLAGRVAAESKAIEKVEPFLTLEGLRIIYEKNRPPGSD